MSNGKRPTCAVVRSTQPFAGKQGFTYQGAISAESVGATGICMHLLAIPPAGRAKPHLHENHETAIYVLQGRAGMWFGDQLGEHVEVRAGDFLYIPAGMPHLPYNADDREPCLGILARTDPNEQESVVLLPQLEGLR
ncbi:MAG TPA: cupin domain-containing protein [Limnochordia bacterium]|nr:cupin domain-containing protein [Limnochordia bacterium]